jgi:hypothetical protein
MRPYLIAVLGMLAFGCEEKKDAPTAAPSATQSAAPVPTLAPPPVVRSPLMSVDEAQCYVGGDRVDVAAADAKGRVAGVLATKPKVEGEVLELHAARATKLSRVTALVAAARTAKAKGLRLITPDRDRNEHELDVTFSALGACSAVASIGKDNGINVWPASGGTAARFTKGMAGPDMTRGIEGVQKAAAACESSVWGIGAEPDMQWGLLFDLASGAMGAFDGGKPMRATQLVVLTDAPVAGRKVD